MIDGEDGIFGLCCHFFEVGLTDLRGGGVLEEDESWRQARKRIQRRLIVDLVACISAGEGLLCRLAKTN